MSQLLTTWLLATRPRTLILAWLAVLLGTGLASYNQSLNLTTAVLTLITATLLQILTNLANDLGDAIKGVDNNKRIGPTRAMQTGLISTKQMQAAIIFIIALCLLSGLSLILSAQISLKHIIIFLLLGALSVIAALTYTLGNKPYGYYALGDLSVFLFFGLIAVAGSYFLQTNTLPWQVFLPSSAMGCLAVAVLNINNMRDLDNDLNNGKLTFAALIGLSKAKIYQIILIHLAFILFITSLFITTSSALTLIFTLTFLAIIKHTQKVLGLTSSNEAASLLPHILATSLILSSAYIFILIMS